MQESHGQLSELQQRLLNEGRLLLDDAAHLRKASLTLSQRAILTQQIQWRKRSRTRFPDPSKWLWSDRSLSQASDWMTACYKASLFPRDVLVLDGCCGAGADAVALAGRGSVLAVDNDPWMVALSQNNAIAHDRIVSGFTELLSAESLRNARWMHIDPDRRASEAKTLEVTDFSPPLSDVLHLARAVSGAMIKIAPSSILDERCTDCLKSGWVRVWVGSRGECRQQLLMTGEHLVSSFLERTKVLDQASDNAGQEMAFAVLLHESDSEQIQIQESHFFGQPCASLSSNHDGIGPLIYDLHPTLFASKLHCQWARDNQLVAITGQYGFYSAQQKVVSPWASGFELLEILPWDDRQVRKWLMKHGVGSVEVKCRLIRLDASAFQRRFSRPTGQPISILVTRVDGRTRCLICRRLT